MSTLRPSLPLLIAFGMLLLVLGQRTALLHDPDTYLHVAAGQWMLAHHALPTHDPFSDSMPGATWLPHEWLAELVMAVLYDLAGWAGLALGTALLFALAMAILTRCLLRHFEPLTGLITVVLAAGLLEPHLLARPHALALPLMVIWAGATIAARDAGRAPPWWLIPVIAVWANLHGSSMAGLVLAAFLGVEAVLLGPTGRLRAARDWALFLGAAVLAALCTPNGLDGFLLPLRLARMTVLNSNFIEWQSPDFQSFQPLDLWIGATMLGLSLGLRLPILRLIVAAVLLLNAIAHQRHGDLLAVLCPLLLAPSLGPALAGRVRSERPSVVARTLAGLARPAGPAGRLAMLAAILLAGGATLAIPINRTDDPVTPANALAAARALDLTGPVFNDEGFGGYLIFAGTRVFIDGRMEMYGDGFLSRYLDAETGHQPALDALLDQYAIQWTLLQPGSVAVQELDRSDRWHRVYADKIAVIHVRGPASGPPAPPEGQP